jgi:hypothetical protein
MLACSAPDLFRGHACWMLRASAKTSKTAPKKEDKEAFLARTQVVLGGILVCTYAKACRRQLGLVHVHMYVCACASFCGAILCSCACVLLLFFIFVGFSFCFCLCPRNAHRIMSILTRVYMCEELCMHKYTHAFFSSYTNDGPKFCVSTCVCVCGYVWVTVGVCIDGELLCVCSRRVQTCMSCTLAR